MAIIRKPEYNDCWWELEKSDSLCTVGSNMRWCSHYEQQYGGSSRATIPSCNLTSGYLYKIIDIKVSKKYLHSMFIAALFTITKLWKQPQRPSLDKQIRDNMKYTCHGIFAVLQSLSCVWLFATPWTAATPSFPVLHHLLKLAQTHVHWVADAIQPSQTK